jgi:hypothetical protein
MARSQRLANKKKLIIMPSINKSLLDLLTEPYQNYSVFIETGTFLGDTIFSVEPLFEKLYTIEISILPN